MANRPFRFIHASDFHLELPPQGLLEIPDHLRELLRDASYLAAERVFETALSSEADFMVLSGDLLQMNWVGLRGPLFLMKQFERLAERDILVYWAGGRIDPPEAWPSGFRLPDNVHVFPKGRPTEVTVWRDETALASIVGCSRSENTGIRAGEFACHRGGLFSIAMIHGRATPDKLLPYDVDYWALGGDHRRNTLFAKPKLAQFPGTPQGRSFKDDCTHGCWVIQVDAVGQPQPSFAATDCLRWYTPRIGIEESTSRDQLELSLVERMNKLAEESPGVTLLVNWTITGTGPLIKQLRHTSLKQQLVQWLRGEFGQGEPSIWCNSIEIEPPARFPSARYAEQTILGDFLRQVRHHQESEQSLINDEELIAKLPVSAEVAQWLRTDEKDSDKRLLREVGMLGMDLLGVEE